MAYIRRTLYPADLDDLNRDCPPEERDPANVYDLKVWHMHGLAGGFHWTSGFSGSSKDVLNDFTSADKNGKEIMCCLNWWCLKAAWSKERQKGTEFPVQALPEKNSNVCFPFYAKLQARKRELANQRRADRENARREAHEFIYSPTQGA